MNDRRTPESPEVPSLPRDERVARGVIAQYIHELADHGWLGLGREPVRDANAAGV
jgi:hypothetical protein